jgi:hypothetical protein
MQNNKTNEPLHRMKDVAQEQYTQSEAEFAAGMTKEILAPAHGGGGNVGMVVG